MIDSIRVVLAVMSALLLLEVSPGPSGPLAMAVCLFATYAGVLMIVGSRGSRLAEGPAVAWLDTGWCLLLYGIAEGRHGLFVLLFFPVLFAALQAQMKASMLIAGLSASAVVIVQSLRPGEISWLHMIILPGGLLMLAPLMAALARSESDFRRGLADADAYIERLDPRQGIEAVVHTTLNGMSYQFSADIALLALQAHGGAVRLFCLEHGEPFCELPETLGRTIAADLLAVPPHLAVLCASPKGPGWLWGARHGTLDLRTGIFRRTRTALPALTALAQLIKRPSLVVVPAGRHSTSTVRLLLGRSRHPFEAPAPETLHHVLEQITPVLDNAILLQRLVTETAETERARIGRDLHDSALQPYIGLKFAVEALAKRVPEDHPLTNDLRRLAETANQELISLREMVSGLRGIRGSGDAVLASAVHRQAARFRELFGIEVEVTVEGVLPVSRRLSGELFHLVAEGLSNICRHTRARQARVSLLGEEDMLTLCIHNAHPPGSHRPPPFEPGSFSERVAELGGLVEVIIDHEGTTVTTHIPVKCA